MLAEILLNGNVTQSGPVDNSTATLTIAAIQGQRHFLGGVEAHYSSAVTLIKNVVVTRTINGAAVTMTYIWDFTRGPFLHNFPLLIHGDYNTPVTVTLTASGTGGITGQVALWSAAV